MSTKWTKHFLSTRGLASYTASLSCFTYNPSRYGEEINTEIVSLAHGLAIPRSRLATKFSINFWPSCPPFPPGILPALGPPNHRARAQIHRRPTGTKACNMQLSIPLRSPPTRLQPPSHGKAGVPASVYAVACVSVDDSSIYRLSCRRLQ